MLRRSQLGSDPKWERISKYVFRLNTHGDSYAHRYPFFMRTVAPDANIVPIMALAIQGWCHFIQSIVVILSPLIIAAAVVVLSITVADAL